VGALAGSRIRARLRLLDRRRPDRVLGLCGLAFETVCLFWDQGSGRKWWGPVLRATLFAGIAAVAIWGLGPFGQAAVMRLTMQGRL
jgi:hypothetical protein